MAQTTPNHKLTVSGWAAHDATGVITPYVFKRRVNGDNDVTIKILYCGICHTDIHHIKNDWGNTMYPVVPGHEITGVITEVGINVKGFKIGDKVGVGCLAASCLKCEFCRNSEENYCDKIQFTYNGIFWDGSITYGGYSEMLVADHRYVLHIPENLPMDATAPLLCAGITVYSPMIDNNLHRMIERRVGIVGLGGLGHVAIKFAKAFGHRVTVISTSPSKEVEARKLLGADDFIISTDPKQMQDIGLHIGHGKRAVKGSMTGGIKETQEMLNFCGENNITCDIETVTSDKINEALTRLAKNDVKYRFVIDIAGKNSSL
ncbi:hypothetical protein Ccrd_014274 [Cynara cardunculus var. scolymus]|uniref:Alcohol dehydrogenase-like N-terminal domain-containing protein n=1 Tax=Cynara cardunculus var. scolymus TaxID=59895 RepID=A0A118K4C3_CYNCS|nr:hypothetical protein Ccrd_014274 [Cynara cardunculus var. scolymus]